MAFDEGSFIVLIVIISLLSLITLICFFCHACNALNRDKKILKSLYPNHKIIYSKFGFKIVPPNENPSLAPTYNIAELRNNNYDINRINPVHFPIRIVNQPNIIVINTNDNLKMNSKIQEDSINDNLIDLNSV